MDAHAGPSQTPKCTRPWVSLAQSAVGYRTLAVPGAARPGTLDPTPRPSPLDECDQARARAEILAVGSEEAPERGPCGEVQPGGETSEAWSLVRAEACKRKRRGPGGRAACA